MMSSPGDPFAFLTVDVLKRLFGSYKNRIIQRKTINIDTFRTNMRKKKKKNKTNIIRVLLENLETKNKSVKFLGY